MNLTSLYTDLVFDHDRHPRHAGLREPFDAEVHHVNPTCGDEVTLRVRLTGEGPDVVVEDVSYEAVGCAMSRASASIMAELLHGRPEAEAQAVWDHFDHVMHQRGKEAGDEELIGDGVALVGAAKFPGRVKCVLLPWKAWQAAFAQARAARG